MSTRATTPVGIDRAKVKFDAAARRGEKYKAKAFSNPPAGFGQGLDWLGQFEQPPVCLEATGHEGAALALYFVEQGVKVRVLNPAQVHAFAQAQLSRTKTDLSDATLIARFCRAQHPPPWQPPRPALRHRLQALGRRLDDLLQRRQRERNRHQVAHAPVQGSLRTVLAPLEAEIEQTRAPIRAPSDQDPALRQRRALLDSIPGRGEATIAVLLALLGEVQRFHAAQAVAAFAGLSPAAHQAGTSQGPCPLSKTGDPLLRKALYLPAVVACQHKPLLRPLRARLKAQGKPGKVIVCAAMRQLLILA